MEEKGPAWVVVDAIWGLLDADLNIPFISMLYKWITGWSLTIMSLLCLLMGLAAHIAHAFSLLLLTGEARKFLEDAGGLAEQAENQIRTLTAIPPVKKNAALKVTVRTAAKPSFALASEADAGEIPPQTLAATAEEAGTDDPNKGNKGAAIGLTVAYAVSGAARLVTHGFVMVQEEEHRASGKNEWADNKCNGLLLFGDGLLGLAVVGFATSFWSVLAKSREPQDMAATAFPALSQRGRASSSSCRPMKSITMAGRARRGRWGRRSPLFEVRSGRTPTKPSRAGPLG